MFTYKHCLKIENGIVTRAYSTGFEPYQDGDIILKESTDRHFNMQTMTMDGLPLYRWQDGLVEIDHSVERERRRILSELAALDILASRGLEDLYDALDLKAKGKTAEAIVKKCNLRLQLKAIGG